MSTITSIRSSEDPTQDSDRTAESEETPSSNPAHADIDGQRLTSVRPEGPAPVQVPSWPDIG